MSSSVVSLVSLQDQKPRVEGLVSAPATALRRARAAQVFVVQGQRGRDREPGISAASATSRRCPALWPSGTGRTAAATCALGPGKRVPAIASRVADLVAAPRGEERRATRVGGVGALAEALRPPRAAASSRTGQRGAELKQSRPASRGRPAGAAAIRSSASTCSESSAHQARGAAPPPANPCGAACRAGPPASRRGPPQRRSTRRRPTAPALRVGERAHRQRGADRCRRRVACEVTSSSARRSVACVSVGVCCPPVAHAAPVGARLGLEGRRLACRPPAPMSATMSSRTWSCS